ncbi:MAG: hypothetical protein ACI8W3_003210 [Myxococcota bacterium]|jgi:hypothetical protein
MFFRLHYYALTIEALSNRSSVEILRSQLLPEHDRTVSFAAPPSSGAPQSSLHF